MVTTTKDVPAEAKGLNWGAFLLSWIWGLGNGAGCGPVALLFILPGIGQVVGLFKGNEWAWKGKQWASVDAFKAAQRKWAMAGVIVLVIALLVACVAGALPALMMGGGGN